MFCLNIFVSYFLFRGDINDEEVYENKTKCMLLVFDVRQPFVDNVFRAFVFLVLQLVNDFYRNQATGKRVNKE